MERARGLSGVLRERGRAVAAALDANADVDVVSTLETEAARLIERAGRRRGRGGSRLRAGAPDLTAALEALDREVAALRERWSAVLGDDAPDQALARVRARTELMTRSAAREQQDLDALGVPGGLARTACRGRRGARRPAGAGGGRDRPGHRGAGGRARGAQRRARGGRPQRRGGPGGGGRGRAGASPDGRPGRGLGARPVGPAGRGRARAAAGGRRGGGLARRPRRDRRGLGRRLRGRRRGGRRRRRRRRAALGTGRADHPARTGRHRGGAGAATTRLGLGRCRRFGRRGAAAGQQCRAGSGPRPGPTRGRGRRVGPRLARRPGGPRRRLGGGHRPLARPRRPRRRYARGRPLRRHGLARALGHRCGDGGRSRGGSAAGGGGRGRR